jgi:PAS domain S-box-containing protein
MGLLEASRSARWVTVLVATLCALGSSATVVAYFLTGRAQGWTVNAAWLTLGVAFVIAMAAARRRAQPSARVAWTLLLAGALCWAFGQVLWVLWLFVPAPATPNLADFGWYAFAVFTGLGLYRLGSAGHTRWWATSAEIAPLAVAVCALVAALVWAKLVDSPFSTLEQASALAYPVLYVSSALAVLQSVTSGSLRLWGNPGLIAIVAGFVFEAAAFIFWCPALLDGSYVAGTHPSDALWSLGLASLALGACFAGTASEPATQQRRLTGVLPGLTLAALVAVQLSMIIEGSPAAPQLIVACGVALVGAALLVRSGVLNREQSQLLERERRASADALAARKELDGFFTSSIGLLGIAGFDGRFHRMNPAWSEVLGWTIDELLASPFLDFVHPDDIDATLKEMATLSDGVDTLNFENRYRCKDGSYRWLAWKCRPDTEAGVIYTAAHDVTDLRLVSKELVTARDQALDASRQKSEFLAMMSHEIRTPLNGVIGMTDLLAGTELDAEQRGYADTVNFSGEALLTIINDILDFSKIEAGRLELDLIDFDVRETVEAVGEQFASRAHEKGLELILDLPGDLPALVHGDPTRVRQILTNLIANAVKFTAAGEIVVGVRAESGALLRFDVRDTGVGVDPAALPRLFESFTQADSSTTRRYGGSGLGLAICKHLTERMGGEIGAESQAGEGSTFWFTVQLEGVRGRAATAPRLDLADVRVLVVDDNATNREILEHQLRGSQMLPETVEDGPSALCRMRAATRRDEPYELLVLDFNMPDMDGLALAHAISADPELTGVPMILLTSSGSEPGEGRRAGIETYLTKPVRQGRLLDAIAQVLGREGEPTPEFVASTIAQPARAAGNQPMPRVLLAEDNEINQAVATITLRKRGFEVEIAGDGQAAVEMAAGGGYAAIFMDCQMPRLDGYDATRAIRRQEAGGSRTPIIAMTASAMRGDRELCLDAGMDDYLAKPLRLDQLQRVLEEWVSVPEPVDGPPAGPAASPVDSAHQVRARGRPA